MPACWAIVSSWKIFAVFLERTASARLHLFFPACRKLGRDGLSNTPLLHTKSTEAESDLSPICALSRMNLLRQNSFVLGYACSEESPDFVKVWTPHDLSSIVQVAMAATARRITHAAKHTVMTFLFSPFSDPWARKLVLHRPPKTIVKWTRLFDRQRDVTMGLFVCSPSALGCANGGFKVPASAFLSTPRPLILCALRILLRRPRFNGMGLNR
ncbi:hypothetical protein B0T25DRAFT_161159 [Lasiosphaeria hispida]|uniref:Secreted protein n=1 Tax=Lasiosphaeria hispida TaxID=260671 RepID=A0AAJ0MG80_9PEZI|nr:hypothetical protein B0T25DRAFT_161159 [Lasiosphaeria hispida]